MKKQKKRTQSALTLLRSREKEKGPLLFVNVSKKCDDKKTKCPIYYHDCDPLSIFNFNSENIVLNALPPVMKIETTTICFIIPSYYINSQY